MEKTKTVAGIDVGKRALDVSVSGGPVSQYANTDAGITALLGRLLGQAVTLVVCESTGGYGRTLVSSLRGMTIRSTGFRLPCLRMMCSGRAISPPDWMQAGSVLTMPA